ncbi:type II toxin-antitoxin system RelE/ParE family toxin [Enterobacter ludwigii]|uniref:type II toxin-antitoxin system RelE/ParE family toxin n=1 Tax=Enterobacter ludwigii TaxID=299767 RepID=UPI003F7169DF
MPVSEKQRWRFWTRAQQRAELDGDWIAQDNPVRAISFTEELYQQCLLIAESPVLYRKRSELQAGIRSSTYGCDLLPFRILDIEKHAMDGSRDINRGLAEPGDNQQSDNL